MLIAVALLLLPVLAVLLYAMDRLEGRLFDDSPKARHARARHLRLVHSTAEPRGRRRRAERRARRDAA
ncbi:hypothetical protein [Streptomyces spectabilis]|uniref:Uncharacterized protein n=1 Tax=Streptomyces spectabilis TaxID=68270 RepID=A0A516R0V1_STRST|nr:hypothetical protein [Streptomyces spectabilis]QDQ09284.1 hypothetical protein FH965_00825 [Streptomyces spectabilis]